MANFISTGPGGSLATVSPGVRQTPSRQKVQDGYHSNIAKNIYTAPVLSFPMKLFYLAVGIVLFMSWHVREEQYIVAKSGLGYALGIVGGSMMLLLLLYPLRKKKRFMRNWGPVKYWFRTHMVLGVIGPAIVMLHTNFQFGSLNSKVVFMSMLLVTGSGFVGQYLYSKVHFGLYGRRITLEKLQSDIENNRNILAVIFAYAPALQKRLMRFETAALHPTKNILHSIGRVLIIDLWKRWNYCILIIRLQRTLKIATRKASLTTQRRRMINKIGRQQIAEYLNIVLRIAEFNFYERMFAMWHLLHFPLFLMLVFTGVIHVCATHMY